MVLLRQPLPRLPHLPPAPWRAVVLDRGVKRLAAVAGFRFDAEMWHMPDNDLIEDVQMDRTEEEECKV